LCSSIELFTKEVLPEFKDREQKREKEKSAQVARLSEIVMPRKQAVEAPKERTVIKAAGHH
jgi:hypothetical protein